MVEDLIEIFKKDFQKYNITGVCVLGSYLFNHYIPDSNFIEGFLKRNNKFYCLLVWIEFENKIYDSGNMYNIRTVDMLHLGNSQYAIEEPVHLENIDENYEKFSL